MCVHQLGGVVPLTPHSLSVEERATLRASLADQLPRLHRLLDSAEGAADGPDPEAAQVFLGMLVAQTAALLFPL